MKKINTINPTQFTVKTCRNIVEFHSGNLLFPYWLAKRQLPPTSTVLLMTTPTRTINHLLYKQQQHVVKKKAQPECCASLLVFIHRRVNITNRALQPASHILFDLHVGSVTNSNNITVQREPLERPPSTSKPMLFTVLNSQSVRNKTLSVEDFTMESDIDILAFTETWLSDESDEYIIRDLCPSGYEFYNVLRGSRGGGVGLLYKKRIRFQKQSCIKAKFRSFEFTDLLLRQDSTGLRVVIVYRPQTVDNRSTESVFFQEFPSLLEKLAIAAGSLLMVGDFNFHGEDCNDRSAQRFLQLLETFNMEQHIREPTHRSGHTLDLMITRAEENIASNFSVHDPTISDHFAVLCTLVLRKVPFERKRLCYRKLKSIDVSELRADIANSSLMNDDVEDVIVLMDNYNSVLSTLLDKHAPIKECVVTVRPAAPWYTEVVIEEKRMRRRLERRWRGSGLSVDREMYVKQCKVVNERIHESKMRCYSGIIEENKSNQKNLFAVANRVLHSKADKTLPTHDDQSQLAEEFAGFFTEKISKIRTSLELK